MSSDSWIDVGARVASSIGDRWLPQANPRVYPSGFTSEQVQFLQDVVKAGITGVARVVAEKLDETDKRFSDIESRMQTFSDRIENLEIRCTNLENQHTEDADRIDELKVQVSTHAAQFSALGPVDGDATHSEPAAQTQHIRPNFFPNLNYNK